MKQLSRKYNQAIELIKEDRLEEAKGLLASLLASAPFHSHTNWSAGLVEIMMGNPVTGLTYWERVDENDFPQLPERREQVLSTLGAYEEVRSVYNLALSLLKEKRGEEAEGCLSPLLQRPSLIPLPQDVYRLYMILLIENGKKEQAFDFFSKAPVSIQKAPSFKSFIQAVKGEVLTEKIDAVRKGTKELAIQRKKKRRKKQLVLTAGVAAAVLIGGVYVGTRDWNTVPVNQAISSTADQTEDVNKEEFEQKIAELESKLTNVESEKESLKQELELELAKVSQYETTEALYEKANLDVGSLRKEEARQAFNSGYSLYKAGDFAGAKEKFEVSYQLDSSEYYSDDSLYYFIQTQKQVGNLTGDSEWFQLFFNSESQHFVESPYRDDLLVLQADAFYREGKNEEALTILTKVQEQFPTEWTANYAKKLAKVIQEG